MSKSETQPKKRLDTLDYLRGFFIIVIVIDHLDRWPSLLEVFTGQGTLWANAACGFVIISGLLIGYVRGYKDRQKPLLETTKKLVRRALILYLWLIICTVIYSAITWYSLRPELLAWVEVPKDEWWLLITSVVTMDNTSNWVHFLGLYAIFLVLSPILIYLLRKKLAWVGLILSVLIYIYGHFHLIEWMQWQILFFVPAIAGFYLENIKKGWQQLNGSKRQMITIGLYSITALSIVISVITTKIIPLHPISLYINTIFLISPIAISVVLLSFIWFVAFILFFNHFREFIGKRLGWLLLPFGTHSLTAYIIHPVTIIAMSALFAVSTSIVLNTVIGIVCVMGTWLLVKQPWLQKVIPR